MQTHSKHFVSSRQDRRHTYVLATRIKYYQADLGVPQRMRQVG